MKHATSIIYYLLLLIIGINSCNTEERKVKNKWPDSVKVQLLEEQVFINVPKSFKRSSRYKVEEDLPLLAKDSSQLLIVQTSLEMMEFKDAEIDVFVDTLAPCRLMVIANTEFIPFDKTSGSIITKALNDDYKELERNNPIFKVNKIDSRIKNNNKQKVLKLKHEIVNTLWETKLYKTIFFISTKRQSFIVYEISTEKEDTEYYLWSIKD